MINIVLHSLVRWGVLFFGVWAVVNAISGVTKKRAFSKTDKLSGLFFMIFCDIQLLIGIILLFTNGWIDKIKAGMGPLMKDPSNRFFVIEHGLIMILAWVLVHIGYSKTKKAAEENKHKIMLRFFGIALFLILISIPWPFRTQVARPLFHWFQ
jgi:hypothetical protein